MKKLKLILSICLLISLVIIPGCKETSTPKKEGLKYSYDRKWNTPKPSGVENLNNNNIFYGSGAEPSFIVLPGKWYTSVNRHYIEKTNRKDSAGYKWDIAIKDWKKYDIDFYDINTNKKIKTINVLKEFNENVDTKKYQLFGYEHILTTVEDKMYVVLYVEKIPSKKELDTSNYEVVKSDKYAFYLSVDGDKSYLSDEIIRYSSHFSGWDYDDNKENVVINNTDIIEKNYPLNSNYYGYDSNKEDEFSGHINCQVYKPVNNGNNVYSNYSLFNYFGYYPDPREFNLNIYNEYPKFREYIIKEYDKADTEDFVELVSKTNEEKIKCLKYKDIYMFVQNDKWQDTVKLFMIEGQEISFQNVVLKKRGTKDNKEHVVNSETEAIQYMKDYPSDN